MYFLDYWFKHIWVCYHFEHHCWIKQCVRFCNWFQYHVFTWLSLSLSFYAVCIPFCFINNIKCAVFMVCNLFSFDFVAVCASYLEILMFNVTNMTAMIVWHCAKINHWPKCLLSLMCPISYARISDSLKPTSGPAHQEMVSDGNLSLLWWENGQELNNSCRWKVEVKVMLHKFW